MGRAKLPEARIEPRGVGGHLAQLKAEVREQARVAGAIGAFLARVIGWTAFAAGTVAVLVWLAPPPRNPRLDEIRRLQDDFARSQANIESARRAMEQLRHVNQVDLRQYQVHVPPYNPDLSTYRAPSSSGAPTYDIGDLTNLPTFPGVAPPETRASRTPTAAK